MTIINEVLNEKPKKKGRPSGSKNKSGGIVKVETNEAQDFWDGEDNEGYNLDLLLSGKKIIWKKIYQISLTNLKRHGTVDDIKYFNSLKYEEPHFILFNKKTKKVILDVAGGMGKGFIQLCKTMNEL